MAGEGTVGMATRLRQQSRFSSGRWEAGNRKGRMARIGVPSCGVVHAWANEQQRTASWLARQASVGKSVSACASASRNRSPSSGCANTSAKCIHAVGAARRSTSERAGSPAAVPGPPPESGDLAAGHGPQSAGATSSSLITSQGSRVPPRLILVAIIGKGWGGLQRLAWDSESKTLWAARIPSNCWWTAFKK